MIIKAVNVLKIVDIQGSKVKQETKNALNEYGLLYSDALENMAEDIYNIEDVRERIGDDELEEIEADLLQMEMLLKENDASYIRIINE